MNNLNVNDVRSPRTPNPPSSQSSFDFSPRTISAIGRLEVSESLTASLLASPCTPYMMAVTPTEEDDVDNEQPMDVNTILDELGLQEYEKLFEKEEIDMQALLLLDDSDLQEIGITDKDHREIIAIAIEHLKLL